MSRWLVRWILNVIGIIITAKLIEGFEVTVLAAIVGSVLLGFVNATIRPVILLVTLPINVLTLGLFTLVVNGFMLWLVSFLIKGFDVLNFGAAFLAALMITIISSLISFLVKD
ncbi:MAG: phage holin family protein [Desulfotomaculaceae bacterium]|nr:phage holin family protein [Desulfotomaculaceae bacterium]